MTSSRRPYFLDTSYLNALVNDRDQWHGVAVNWARLLATQRQPLLTTEFVLIEFADALSAVRFRAQAVATIETLTSNSLLEIIPATSSLFVDALNLYQRRMDKSWGLTDCTSFIVMEDRGIDSALSTDNHFRQAGFRPLLIDETPRR